MFASARKAAELIFDRTFLHVVLKAVGLTVLLFLILFAGVEYAFYHLPIAHSAGVNAALSILGLIVFLLLAMFLGAPVAALFASLFADDLATTVGPDHGERVRRWFQAKKAGWYTVLADPQMPAMSTVLDQAHNAIERKLFAMKGSHHPGGSQQAFLSGLAHLYNLVPYQRRAQHAGQCGVEVEGGRVPTRDWFLNVQILTSGGFR